MTTKKPEIAHNKSRPLCDLSASAKNAPTLHRRQKKLIRKRIARSSRFNTRERKYYKKHKRVFLNNIKHTLNTYGQHIHGYNNILRKISHSNDKGIRYGDV